MADRETIAAILAGSLLQAQVAHEIAETQDPRGHKSLGQAPDAAEIADLYLSVLKKLQGTAP